MSVVFSIIMPLFNASDTLVQAVDSVISQSFLDWELIIIDDFSNDNSYTIAKKYVDSDPRIKVIHLENNSGVATARNVGIDNAKGDYIAFLDSDDYWAPNKLEIQLKYFNKYSSIDVVFSEYYRFNSHRILGKVGVPNTVIQFNNLLKGNCIGNLTGVYKRQKFIDVRQKKVGAEDYLFWLEVFSKPNVKGIGIPEAIAYYRVADTTKSLSSNKFRSAKWTWDIYAKHLQLPLYQVIYYFTLYIYKSIKNRF